MTREVHFELLLGRRVHDVNGRVAGRILGIRATAEGAKCVIDEYELGIAAFLMRLGITTAGLVGIAINREPLRVPWRLLDLTDPDHPRLTVPLETLQAQRAAEPKRPPTAPER